MAKAVQPALAADEITLELERFELVDGRLVLVGRWFGVRGRRFVRPTLTPIGGRNLSRVLADLEHKPWAAEAGERWEAAFPWVRGGAPTKFELSVAPDIVIRLPPPSAKLARPRRFPALPRQPSIEMPWRQPQTGAPPSPAAISDAERAVDEAEEPARRLEAITAELEAARQELDAAAAARDAAVTEAAAAVAARDQLVAESGELKAEREELRAALADLGTARGELTGAHAEREAAYGELQAAYAELGAAHTEVTASADQLSQERDQLSADLATSERVAGELRAELERASLAVKEAARERDEAISAHGAAIVMRRATRAAPYPAHSAGVWRTALALLALVGIMFAILIVAHVL